MTFFFGSLKWETVLKHTENTFSTSFLHFFSALSVCRGLAGKIRADLLFRDRQAVDCGPGKAARGVRQLEAQMGGQVWLVIVSQALSPEVFPSSSSEALILLRQGTAWKVLCGICLISQLPVWGQGWNLYRLPLSHRERGAHRPSPSGPTHCLAECWVRGYISTLGWQPFLVIWKCPCV